MSYPRTKEEILNRIDEEVAFDHAHPVTAEMMAAAWAFDGNLAYCKGTGPRLVPTIKDGAYSLVLEDRNNPDDWGPYSFDEGWFHCDGRSLRVREYPELFDVIGHRYGVADGRNFFCLPKINYRREGGFVHIIKAKHIESTDFASAPIGNVAIIREYGEN